MQIDGEDIETLLENMMLEKKDFVQKTKIWINTIRCLFPWEWTKLIPNLKLSKWQLQLMKPKVLLPKLAPWITENWRQSSLKKAKRTCWLNKGQNTDLISHFFYRIATWKMPHCLGDTHIRLAPHGPKIPIRRSTWAWEIEQF
jgi:hypothetical protein